MAKLQGLSLSPNKISGYCGKLDVLPAMKNEYYQETAKKMPKIGSVVTTPEGKGTAVGVDFLRCQVKIRFEGEDGGVEIKNYPYANSSSTKEQLIDDIKAEIEDEAFSDKEGQD